MENPLAHYFPDDFPWRQLNNFSKLKTQCEVRNLSTRGTKEDLHQRLIDHQKLKRINGAEKRLRKWFAYARPFYFETLTSAEAAVFRIVQIQHNSEPRWDYPRPQLQFTLTRDGGQFLNVVVKQTPVCDCDHVPESGPRRCVHIMYILRFVLNVPEPLRFQAAFLTSEIQKMCGNGHPVQALLQPDRYLPNHLCLVCFKDGGNGIRCSTCGIGMHLDCESIMNMVRNSNNQCPVCLDKAALGLERLGGTSVDRPIERGGPGADEDSSEEESSEDEQPINAPVQPNNQQPRSNTPGLYIKQTFSPPPRLGPRSPSILIKDESSPSPPPQQPPSSPLRRRQPSRAAKDRGLVRQSLAATAEAPADTPRRTQGRALRRTPANNRAAHVPVQSNTPIPLPVIPAQALQQIQQHQHNQERHTAHTNSAPVALIPAAAPLVDPVEALASGSGSAAQPAAQPAVAPAPQALGSDVIPAPVGSSAAVSSSPAPAPSSGTAPPRASARAGVDKRRKAAKLARKLESIARESAYVREHADRELKRLAKKSRRLEKKAKALAKQNEADGDE